MSEKPPLFWKVSAPIPDPRLVALVLGVQYVYEGRVAGDVIEFGVRGGYTTGVLLQSMAQLQVQEADYPRDRRLWLCDSFRGFPEADDPVDAASPMSGIWRAGSSKFTDVEALWAAAELELPGQVRIVEGWYKDTEAIFAGLECRYSLVHCDCDMYSSTMDCLSPLFSSKCISPGCMILFDDWNAAHGDPGFGQRFAWGVLSVRYGIRESDEGSYGASGHKFIVHGYGG